MVLIDACFLVQTLQLEEFMRSRMVLMFAIVFCTTGFGLKHLTAIFAIELSRFMGVALDNNKNEKYYNLRIY